MNKFRKGFTLIGLLVVIGVLAVIAAGVVALINPQDKLRQANDAKVQSDIGQLGTAAQSYAAQNNGVYPNGTAALTTSGELTSIPVPPGGYGAAYGFVPAPAGCTGGPTGTCVSVTVSAPLRSLKYNATPFWVYCSTTGRAGPSTAANVCP